MSRKVDRGEVLGIAAYEPVRESFRARVIDEKKGRRVKLGDKATVLFENHDTVLLQIQEMLRTERISREDAVLHEIATYNDLLGGPNDLGATMMIEIEDATERVRFLESALGLASSIVLSIGDSRSTAKIDPAREHTDRLSAVVYLTFSLSDAARTLLAKVRAGSTVVKASLSVDHPAYRASTRIGDDLIYELAQDFA